jgi:TonB family protein
MTDFCKTLREELALEEEWVLTDAQKQHLATCASCQSFVASLEAIDRGLESLPEHDVSDSRVRALHRRIRSPKRAPFRIFIPAAATALLAATFLVWTMRHDQRSVPRDEESEGWQVHSGAGGGLGGGTVSSEESKEQESREELRDLKSLGYAAAEPPPRPLAEPPPPPPVAQPSADAPGRADGNVAGIVGGERGQSLDDKDDLAAGKKGKGSFAQNEGDEVTVFAEAPPPPREEPNEGLPLAPTETPAFFSKVPAPPKRVDRKPAYPEKAKASRVQGTVLLELTVDQEGNVVAVKVLRSVPGLDEAAVEAAKQWKYLPSSVEGSRTFVEGVPFELENEPEPNHDRSSLEDLTFREARGYWRNTYVPGDPMLRLLQARLAKASLELFGEHPPLLHRASHRAPLPYDAPENRALSLYVHADTAGTTERRRVLVQVGLRAADRHGRRRPPMNVGIVLDLSAAPDEEEIRSMRALLEAFERSRELGDRLRLVVAGRGPAELLASDTFRHGPLTVALDDLFANQSAPGLCLRDAMALAMERVHAGDDPTMPIGTSLLVMVTSRSIREDVDDLSRLAHESALGGVPLSVVGAGTDVDAEELERLALAGQGRRHFVERASEAEAVVDRELSATSRVVARAVRLRIKLAEGVQLVDLLGSEPLSAKAVEQTREAERAIDLRLARNLGIEADRGEDEDGIQIVIPSFYSGDAHTFLLDVVVPGPGPVAEVTARYKDLAELENTVARASLALTDAELLPGPLETSVVEDYLSFEVSRVLADAADALGAREPTRASTLLRSLRGRLSEAQQEMPRLSGDIAMLDEYLSCLSSPNPRLQAYLLDSLRFASALKRLSPPAFS